MADIDVYSNISVDILCKVLSTIKINGETYRFIPKNFSLVGAMPLETDSGDPCICYFTPKAICNEIGEEECSIDLLEDSVNAYLAYLSELSDRFGTVFVILPQRIEYADTILFQKYLSPASSYNDIDMVRSFLQKKLASFDNIFIIDTGAMRQDVGALKTWFYSKNHFDLQQSNYIKRMITAGLNFRHQGLRKLIAVDLDNTLWGGVLGENGFDEIRIGGHDPLGECYQYIQRLLKAYVDRGGLLAILSKNDLDDVMYVLNNHPEMLLTSTDFVAIEANWNDKSANIQKIAKNLNLGTDSFVFIDDSPIERIKMEEANLGIKVLQNQGDPYSILEALLALEELYPIKITNEDIGRTSSYRSRQEIEKFDAESEVGIATRISLIVEVENLREDNFIRIAQLFNKTNQFNLSTRRIKTPTLTQIKAELGCNVFAVKCKDIYGDYGIIGILGVNITTRVVVHDLVLSCRVIGRGVEESMLRYLIELTKSANLEEIHFLYQETAKNTPLFKFLSSVAYFDSDQSMFILNVINDSKSMDFIAENSVAVQSNIR